MKTSKLNLVLLSFASLLLCIFALKTNAQTVAPGGPGKDAQWATAGKQAVGTSASLESRVWFTLAQGVMTEVYYPDVTTANVHLLQFVVVNPKTKKVETEQDDAVHEVKVTRPDSLTFQQINTAKSGEWKITKSYATDPQRDSTLIDVGFASKNKDLNLYLYYDPSLGNSGMHDSATQVFGLVSGEMKSAGNITSSIEIKYPGDPQTFHRERLSGFYQISDGVEQLRKYGRIRNQYRDALNGNVVQMDRIEEPRNFTIVLAFADTTERARQNLRKAGPITSKPCQRSIPSSRPSSTWPRCN